MTAINLRHFDALNYVEDAAKVGMNEDLAKFHARKMEQFESMMESKVESLIDNKEKVLATKKDISGLEVKLERDIASVEMRIAELKVELIKWILATGVGGVVAIAGLLKFMIH